jgi:hypothetical protein
MWPSMSMFVEPLKWFEIFGFSTYFLFINQGNFELSSSLLKIYYQ